MPSSRPVAGFAAIFNRARSADATGRGRRFQCWTRQNILQFNAMDITLERNTMKYSLDRPQYQVYSTEAMLGELRRVAAHYENRRFSRREYDAVAAACKGSAILARFGSWQGALDAAGLQLEKAGKNRWLIADQQLFEEMERVWSEVGHRPSHDEWVSHNPRYSYTTYKARFKGWVNACAAFIAYVSGEEPNNAQAAATSKPEQKSAKAQSPANLEKRNVSDKLRYRVLARDHFQCVLCGRSPASEPGVKLHIDHIVPFSKGGKTELENLRSACNTCNWGKGSEVEIAL